MSSLNLEGANASDRAIIELKGDGGDSRVVSPKQCAREEWRGLGLSRGEAEMLVWAVLSQPPEAKYARHHSWSLAQTSPIMESKNISNPDHTTRVALAVIELAQDNLGKLLNLH